MKLVVIESPLVGEFAKNLRYARLCALDCIWRGEAPYASHLFFTQFLNDAKHADREMGIRAGLQWAEMAQVRAVYEDLGMSSGMQRGIADANRLGQTVEYRRLSPALWRLFSSGGAAVGTEGSI